MPKLRTRVRRFKRLGKALDKLKSPTLEKALLFRDDELLGSTSNAVERGNRRFRKAQRSVYSVRTAQQIRRRLALDLHREQRAARRARTLKSLHCARSGHDSKPPEMPQSRFSRLFRLPCLEHDVPSALTGSGRFLHGLLPDPASAPHGIDHAAGRGLVNPARASDFPKTDTIYLINLFWPYPASRFILLWRVRPHPGDRPEAGMGNGTAYS
jgi:hypothetical protein